MREMTLFVLIGIGLLALGWIVLWWRMRRQQWYRSWNAMLREREVRHRREVGAYDTYLTERRAKVQSLNDPAAKGFANSPRFTRGGKGPTTAQ